MPAYPMVIPPFHSPQPSIASARRRLLLDGQQCGPCHSGQGFVHSCRNGLKWLAGELSHLGGEVAPRTCTVEQRDEMAARRIGDFQRLVMQRRKFRLALHGLQACERARYRALARGQREWKRLAVQREPTHKITA